MIVGNRLIVLILLFILSGCNNEIITIDSIKEIEALESDQVLSSEIMQKEVEFIYKKIKNVHLDPYRNNKLLDKNYFELKKNVQEDLDVSTYALLLMEFTASIGDAHTYIAPNIKNDVLPFSFEWVKEGLVITNSQESKLQAGDLIIKMGEYPIETLFNELPNVISHENKHWVKALTFSYLRRDMILEYLSVLDEGEVSITFERDGVIHSENIALISIDDWMINKPESYSKMFFDNVAYIAINESVYDKEYERFIDSFFKEVHEKGIQTIILDLRSNGGGNSAVITPFINHLNVDYYLNFGVATKKSEEAEKERGVIVHPDFPPAKEKNNKVSNPFEGEVYTLVGKHTFSSGNIFAVTLHDSNLTKLVGEPTGQPANVFGDIITIELPYTKWNLYISHKEFFRPNPTLGNDKELKPDILIEKTREDILTNSDGQIEELLKMIN
ncbi:S41 family peptidase [Halalkalibacterium halodurans]|uniref:S41 family peptidase n=1 Tax=Halalkalibacterium halodurans TaxID=86665 RepID=UPI002AAA3D9B|nr:S41 family peptidase [Halalkalibacterium halodurans]MDY7221441.1 S41 family peptidase [Halalkalibacterium halodurans]MDY7240680.1 S41 family peptidase [Halalkalibacterium halodurans]